MWLTEEEEEEVTNPEQSRWCSCPRTIIKKKKKITARPTSSELRPVWPSKRWNTQTRWLTLFTISFPSTMWHSHMEWLEYFSKRLRSSASVCAHLEIHYLLDDDVSPSSKCIKSLWSPPETSGWAMRVSSRGDGPSFDLDPGYVGGRVCFWEQACPDGPVTTCHLGMWHPLNSCAGYHMKSSSNSGRETDGHRDRETERPRGDGWNLLLDDSAVHELLIPQLMCDGIYDTEI